MEKVMIPEESLNDICGLLAGIIGRVGENRENGYVCYNVPGAFWYNRNVLGRGAAGRVGEAIDKILAERKSQNPVLISYTKENLIEDLDKVFFEKKFEHEVTQIGMIRNLEGYTYLKEDPAIVRIDKEAVTEWAAAMAKGFGKPFEPTPYETLVERKDCYLYAYLDGNKIFGTAMLYANPENAGIHEVCTLPEYRRKGIANHLVIKILNTAKGLNIPIASLQASEMGEKVYTALGFEKVSEIPTWILKRPDK